MDYVLEGTVRWDRSRGGPGRVRITPQLIRVADDTHLWAASYEREMADVFALQSDVAGEVVRALGQSLTPQQASAVGRVPTKDLRAYDLYLQAMRLASSTYDARDRDETVRLLEAAVARDPRFAEAHALLARQHLLAFWFYQDRSESRLESARVAAERAVSLAPDTPESHLALDYYYYRGHLDYERAPGEVRMVLRLRPEDPEAILLQAFVSRGAGQIEDGLRLLERVVAVDPGNLEFLNNLASSYWLLRRYPEADRTLERALSLNPHWGRNYAERAGVRVCQTGNLAEARALLSSAPTIGELREGALVSEGLIAVDFLERHYEQALDILGAGDRDAFSQQFSSSGSSRSTPRTRGSSAPSASSRPASGIRRRHYARHERVST